jgi:hypothetical protein
MPAGLTVWGISGSPHLPPPSAVAGARMLVNLSASPFHVGKDRQRGRCSPTAR